MEMERPKNPCIRRGGGCEKLFNRRKEREKGVQLAIDWLLDNSCIIITKQGWCSIIKIPKKICSLHWPIDNIGVPYGGNAEIGWRRFIQDVAPALKKSKEKFRLSKLRLYAKEYAALEFAFSGFKQLKLSMCQPHRDAEYKQWLESEVKE